MANLNDEFENFQTSKDSKKPVFHVKSDWRKIQYENAKINGDLKSDKTVNREVSATYAEADELFEEVTEPDGSAPASW